MGSVSGSNSTQGTLFDHDEEPRLFFSTNQKNLLSILGSGVLAPAQAQFRYDKDSREIFYGKVGLWKGGVPDSDIEAPDFDPEREVVLEFDGKQLAPFSGKGLILEHQDFLIFDCPLPLSAVKAIYMRSQACIDDFLLRLTDDVIAEKSLFGVLGDCSLKQLPLDFIIENECKSLNAVRFIDRIGGAMKCLTRLQPSQPSSIDYAELLLSICIAHFGFGNLKDAEADNFERISTIDSYIILELLEILGDIHPEQGVDHESILARMNEKLQTLGETDREELSGWLNYSRKVLGAEVDAPTLDDKGDVIKRGVLLFLLRPDLDRLKNSVDSFIKPGPAVLVVATFLCGYFTGLLRLGSDYKGDYSDFVSFVESLLIAFSCNDLTSVEAVSEPCPIYIYSRVLRVNGVGIWSRRIPQNETLARVMSQAKTAGYELDYDYQNHTLSYNFQMPRDRSQKVYIELIAPLSHGAEVIRFLSPCQDLSRYKKKSPAGPKAIEFLTRNGRSDMYSSFAISETLEAIVVTATQIVRTMQDEEFELLLNHVATVADEYEREVLGKDVY
ncbi:hypothetical protein OAI54_04725 [Pseudomonadales bacterium]|nr:hypothetical protein [Pseudomonadales bacterium]